MVFGIFRTLWTMDFTDCSSNYVSPPTLSGCVRVEVVVWMRKYQGNACLDILSIHQFNLNNWSGDDRSRGLRSRDLVQFIKVCRGQSWRHPLYVRSWRDVSNPRHDIHHQWDWKSWLMASTIIVWNFMYWLSRGLRIPRLNWNLAPYVHVVLYRPKVRLGWMNKKPKVLQQLYQEDCISLTSLMIRVVICSCQLGPFQMETMIHGIGYKCWTLVKVQLVSCTSNLE